MIVRPSLQKEVHPRPDWQHAAGGDHPARHRALPPLRQARKPESRRIHQRSHRRIERDGGVARCGAPGVSRLQPRMARLGLFHPWARRGPGPAAGALRAQIWARHQHAHRARGEPRESRDQAARQRALHRRLVSGHACPSRGGVREPAHPHLGGDLGAVEQDRPRDPARRAHPIGSARPLAQGARTETRGSA